MRFSVLLLLILLIPTSVVAQKMELSHQVYILGNLVDAVDNDLFFKDLERRIIRNKNPFTLLLNGDITKGEPKGPVYKKQLKRIQQVLAMVEQSQQGQTLILPGDRDWNSSKRGGQRHARILEQNVKQIIFDNSFRKAHWLLDQGCPGPELIEINSELLVIAINSQWWNHPYDKPRPDDGICPIITYYDFMEEMEDAISENPDKNILIAAHHPFQSLGIYGGDSPLIAHLTPLPIVGTLKRAYHKNVGNAFDISNINLKPLRDALKNLFHAHSHMLFVGSHEHNQQIIRLNHNYLINGGAPVKGGYASKNFQTIFSSKKAGLLVINYHNEGTVTVNYLDTKQSLAEKQSFLLFRSICTPEINYTEIPFNFALAPCVKKKPLKTHMTQKYPTPDTVIAGAEYYADPIKSFWFGKHYRATWITPVEVPFLDLDTTFQGLTIYKKGGGRQTIALKFKGGDGRRYTFRSVNKDPSRYLNYKVRPTIAASILRDQTSTAHPYGALVIHPLLEKLDILHAQPKLYLLPDDEKLGRFQSKFGNMLGMLEVNPGNEEPGVPKFAQADTILKSRVLFNQLFNHQNHKVHLSEFLRARVFDILVGDWSKHEDNWKWAGFNQKNGIVFRPIPRDRDYVFSLLDGVIPQLMDRQDGLENIENFGYKVKGLKSLMWEARYMDRLITNAASRDDWREAALYIQRHISEEDIDRALQELPPEVYPISGNTIAKKLKSRLQLLPKYAEDYYKMLAKDVDLVGTTKAEYIEVIRDKKSEVTIRIFNVEGKQKGNTCYYDRTFYAKETREICIYALSGDDVFDFIGRKKSKIKIRLLGGPGADTFKDRPDAKSRRNFAYDKGRNTNWQLKKGARIIRHWNKKVYEFDRNRQKSNSFLASPSLAFNYNTGLVYGGKMEFIRRRFGKTDYSSKHNVIISASYRHNRAFEYSGRFHQVFRDMDLTVLARAAAPEYLNTFYGLGNKSAIDQKLDQQDYYRVDYSTYKLATGFGKEFWNNSSFDLSIGWEQNISVRKEGTILDSETAPFGANTELTMIPIKAQLDFDFRDSKGLPMNGARFSMEYEAGLILNEASKNDNYGIGKGALEYYFTTYTRKPVSIGLRLGGSYNLGATPYYKFANLGNTSGLRGYKETRFWGAHSLYFNSEARWQLSDRKTDFIPVKFGMKLFFDTGRVFSDQDKLRGSWHTGYGMGFYMIPFSQDYTLSIAVGFSDEEEIYPIISFRKALR